MLFYSVHRHERTAHSLCRLQRSPFVVRRLLPSFHDLALFPPPLAYTPQATYNSSRYGQSPCPCTKFPSLTALVHNCHPARRRLQNFRLLRVAPTLHYYVEQRGSEAEGGGLRWLCLLWLGVKVVWGAVEEVVGEGGSAGTLRTRTDQNSNSARARQQVFTDQSSLSSYTVRQDPPHRQRSSHRSRRRRDPRRPGASSFSYSH